MQRAFDIAGVVLCGGRSRRMGGGDKSLIEIAGATLLARAVSRLERQVSRLAINANGDPSRFAAFAFPVIADSIPGFVGPLAGVLTAMRWAAQNGSSAVVTVPGDSPFFPSDLVARLDASRTGDDTMIAVAGSHGRRHPVFALWPAALRFDVERQLQQGTRRMSDYIDRYRTVEVDFPAEEDGVDPFFNINTPHDLEQAGRFIAS